MSCERYRDWMTSAAAGELQGSRRAELEMHLGECAACDSEFQRVRTLFEAIDLGVTAQSAGEVPRRLIGQVRQRIRDEAPVAPWWNVRWVPAAACAAVLILAASVWTFWPQNKTPRELIVSSATPSPTRTNRAPDIASTGTPRITPEPREPLATLVRPVRKVNARRIERQPEVPEVIVPPEQMKAVMLFVQVLNSRQIDGAKLLAGLKTADQPLEVQPLEIKPLVIAPLETPTLAEDKSGESAPDGDKKKFIDSEISR